MRLRRCCGASETFRRRAILPSKRWPRGWAPSWKMDPRSESWRDQVLRGPILGLRAPRGDWETINAAFEAAATRHGYDAEDVLLADVGARAGNIVVLPEEQSAFAEAYSEAIAGGNLTRHVLDPSVLNVEDLWTRPGSGQSTAFSKAWTAARFDPSNFFVVLLDGLHRTPLDLWMPSLIDVLDSSLRPSNLLVLATLGPSFIKDESRIWKRLDRSVVAVDPALTTDSTALLGGVNQ